MSIKQIADRLEAEFKRLNKLNYIPEVESVLMRTHSILTDLRALESAQGTRLPGILVDPVELREKFNKVMTSRQSASGNEDGVLTDFDEAVKQTIDALARELKETP